MLEVLPFYVELLDFLVPASVLELSCGFAIDLLRIYNDSLMWSQWSQASLATAAVFLCRNIGRGQGIYAWSPPRLLILQDTANGLEPTTAPNHWQGPESQKIQKLHVERGLGAGSVAIIPGAFGVFGFLVPASV